MRQISRSILVSAIAVIGSATAAQASIVTQWNFENQPITGAPPYNNSPTPSTGAGTATPIGFGLYPTPNVGVVSSDIVSDTGSSDPLSLQAWRLRDQASATSGPANGWYSGAPQYTQGAEFDVSTAGTTGVGVSFDWNPTNRGVADVELQYNLNTSIPGGWINLVKSTNPTAGGVWNTVPFTPVPGADNDPNFGIRIVSAYHDSTGAYADTNGLALNNTSGNVRLDNVTVSGASVPEPTSFALLAVGGLGLLARRRRTA